MVIACGGRSEWYMDVARVQDRGRSTLIPSSEVRKHGSEVSQWNHIQSVRHSTTCARQMEWLSFTWMTDTGAGRRRLLQNCWHFSLRRLRLSTCKESGVAAVNTWKLWKYVTGRNWRASRTRNISSQRRKSWRWAIARGVFLQNWTRRASMVTTRNWVKNRRQGSHPQCLLCCNSATKERTSKAQYDCCVRSYTKCGGNGGSPTVDESQELQDKELMATRQYKPVPVENSKVYWHGWGACWIQLYIPAMHVTFLLGLIVPASYDEYTALVKSDNVVKQTRLESSQGCVLLVETWIPWPIELCDVSSGYVACPLLFFPSARVNWCSCASVVIFSMWSIRCLVSLYRFQSSVCCAVHVARVCFQ